MNWEFHAEVKEALILLEAESLMIIDFGKDVGPCVSGTKSSWVESVVERPVLWFKNVWDLVGFARRRGRKPQKSGKCGSASE